MVNKSLIMKKWVNKIKKEFDITGGLFDKLDFTLQNQHYSFTVIENYLRL